jgi:hypothetical protein
MSRYLNPLTLVVIGLLVAGGLGFGYATDRIGFGMLVFLGILTLALGVIAVIFARKMTHPDVSVEQMLYKTDHRTRT